MHIDALRRHDRPCLQFSGGKDSLACLTLLRPWWDKLIVIWTNAGDPFPETVALMEKVRRSVHRFVEVKADVKRWIAETGWPVDMLPVRRAPMGLLTHGAAQPMVPFLACCGANIWEPMRRAVLSEGATLIVRGQKRSDPRRGPLASGAVVDGIEYLYPIEGWSDADVFAYLAREGVPVPEHYALTETSLDCMHCTAYLDENIGKIRWMKSAYPDAHAEIVRRLSVIRDDQIAELSLVNEALV